MHKSFTKESGDATIHRLPAYIYNIIQYANRSSRGEGDGGCHPSIPDMSQYLQMVGDNGNAR
jgi:hypothetical protein